MKVVARVLGLSAIAGAGAAVGVITSHRRNRSLDPRIANAPHK
jgi:hypothetical protein